MKNALLISIALSLIFSARVLAHDVTEGDMESYGRHAAQGDLTAIDKIEDAYNQLYKNIDFQKDGDTTRSNLTLMNAAFDKIGKAVKGDDPSDPAFHSLIYATGRPNLAGFTANAFGTAAAAGHQQALDVLLHYKEHGLLLSSAVEGLIPVAANGNKQAIDFLVAVINDDSKKPLWFMASEGLVAAANDGNADAKAAMAKYAASRN